MILSPNRIKKLGIFRDFSWPAGNALPAFKRFNLIYGSNGSGKTTLCRFFSALNQGSSTLYPDLEYRLTLEGGGTVTNGQTYAQKIRVFDSSYVQRNIGEIEGRINPIIILGEENKDLIDQIAAEEAEIARREADIAIQQPQLERETKLRSAKFTDVAKAIATSTSGRALRTYRKPEAEAAYSKISDPVILPNDEVENYRLAIRQILLVEVPEVVAPSIASNTGQTQNLENALRHLVARAKELLPMTVEAKALQQFNDRPELSRWVEEGLHLHENSDVCQFCLQELPVGRIAELAAHFNKADQELKESITELKTLLETCETELKDINFPPMEALYLELQTDYTIQIEAFNQFRSQLAVELGRLNRALSLKLANRNDSITNCPTLSDGMLSKINSVNLVIQVHNAKSIDFEGVQETARERLEIHHLSEIRAEVGEIDLRIATLTANIEELRNGSDDGSVQAIAALKESIASKRSQVSDSHRGAAELNSRLHAFLGRSDLAFSSRDEGYEVHRNGQLARNLSEGEKTAVAFVYFTVHLEDQEFVISEGTIVIDDPISSMDAGAVYQAFSFLKHAVKDAKQVFLLTHNFEFLQLLINWLNSSHKNHTRYYMLVSSDDGTSGRSSAIKELDKELALHATEYNFLFKILYQFRSDGTIANSYPIPNMARKLMDTFLFFYYPDCVKVYKALERISLSNDPHKVKWNALYKYANDLSHHSTAVFNPALVPATQTNVGYLLEMIETVAPDHYQSLIASINQPA